MRHTHIGGGGGRKKRPTRCSLSYLIFVPFYFLSLSSQLLHFLCMPLSLTLPPIPLSLPPACTALILFCIFFSLRLRLSLLFSFVRLLRLFLLLLFHIICALAIFSHLRLCHFLTFSHIVFFACRTCTRALMQRKK